MLNGYLCKVHLKLRHHSTGGCEDHLLLGDCLILVVISFVDNSRNFFGSFIKSQTTQHRAGETRPGVWRRTLTRGSTPLRPCCHGAVLWLLCTSRLLPAPAIFIFFILNLVSYLSRKVFKPFPLWGRYLLRWWEQVKSEVNKGGDMMKTAAAAWRGHIGTDNGESDGDMEP